jgi:hypothetical protein
MKSCKINNRKQIQKLGGAGKPQDADDPGNRNPIFSKVAGIT